MKKLALSFICSLVMSSAQAAELSGVQMPDSIEIEGQTRYLNGLGLRLATMFKVKVYVAGLYVSEKSNEAESLLKNTDSKLIKMTMLRDLKASQLQDAFKEGFEKACIAQECETYKTSLKQFIDLQPEVKNGQSIEYIMSSEKIEIKLNSQSLGSIVSKDFASVLLRVWIGNNPPNPELKRGLLGLAK